MILAPPPPPAWWLPGAHAQTVWARMARSRHLIRFEREVLSTTRFERRPGKLARA